MDDLRDGLDDSHERDLEEAADDAADALALLLDREELETAEMETYERGARAKVKLTRGNAVRDQEEWTLEGQGRDALEAREELESLLSRYEQEWGGRVRALNPGGDDDG